MRENISHDWRPYVFMQKKPKKVTKKERRGEGILPSQFPRGGGKICTVIRVRQFIVQ